MTCDHPQVARVVSCLNPPLLPPGKYPGLPTLVIVTCSQCGASQAFNAFVSRDVAEMNEQLLDLLIRVQAYLSPTSELWGEIENLR